MRILLVGDVHGKIEKVSGLLARAKAMFRIGAAIQVGDFGFFESVFLPGRIASLYFSVPFYVVDGNHEDHDWLERQADTGRVEAWKEAHNLFYQPRGSVLRIGSSCIGFLGGALHVDRPQKINYATGVSNHIQQIQREEAGLVFNREKPDLVVTHTCPSGIGVGVRGSDGFQQGVVDFVRGAGFDPGPVADCGDGELAVLWRSLKFRPSAWAFGHFHRTHEAQIEGTRFVCVDQFDPSVDFPLVIWDTEEKRLLVLTGERRSLVPGE